VHHVGDPTGIAELVHLALGEAKTQGITTNTELHDVQSIAPATCGAR
jgi:hypothetical protein